MNSPKPKLFPSARTPSGLRALALAALLSLPGLTGCVSVRVHRVAKTVAATNVLNATLDQLVTRMNAQFNSIQTINATVEIAASTGGAHEGEVKEIPTFSGYIFLRKPQDLRVLLLLPFVRSRALDMVSDGKTFKLLVPPRNRAITGTDESVDLLDSPAPPAIPQPPVTTGKTATLQSRNAGLESLRPYIVRDALLIPAITPDEFYTLTEDTRLLPPAAGRKESMEEPDYDVTILRKQSGQSLQRVRVIHIGRIDLEPYQQDIYDRQGRIVTTVIYTRYAKFGVIPFPMHIFIKRPIDEYTLDIDITKLQLNTKFDDEQFLLTIPDKVPIQKMP